MAAERDSVVILGSGVVGLCAAYYALREGLSVTVLERGSEHADNCSFGNAGMIVPSHFTPLAAPGMIAKGLKWMLDRKSPFYVKPRFSPDLLRWGWLFHRYSTQSHVEAVRQLLCELNLESRRLFEELAREEDFAWTPRGLLMLCKTQHGLDEEAAVAEIGNNLGLKTAVLNAAEASKLDPKIDMDILGAVHFVQDAHLNPMMLMGVLRRRVTELGGTIIYHQDISRIETSGGKVVAFSGPEGRHEASRFVIAAGAWTSKLVKQVGLKLPMQAGKGYSLTLEKPTQLPELCSILTEAKVAVTPMSGALRFAGTMQVGGLDLSVDPVRVQGIVESVQKYFPKFTQDQFQGVKPWAGLRPVSPDGVPYLGKVDGLENFVVATGHAMMGLSLGPVSGQLIVDQLIGRSSFRPIKALAPGRFS